MKNVQWPLNTPVGRLYLLASERGLQGIYWKKQRHPTAKNLKEAGAEIKILARAARELDAYFGGRLPWGLFGRASREDKAFGTGTLEIREFFRRESGAKSVQDRQKIDAFLSDRAQHGREVPGGGKTDADEA